ncbi:MAG: response regulator transcription factor [Gammaproteobacteria bacterium]|jgi:two-component system, NarL family, invasion response regulator UvrY|nr:response regulator transcription factor [Gammaproteobacteria bacterium]MBU0771073.1 response regulator transcription factor [Gammaproteobacteria bacterium]MBU0854654.1 response regulator transcription factor [Gammaproteobacteria bacterium]MBU1845986.1 response regulator transcription factor [Gammaproteobacteria bacterium]
MTDTPIGILLVDDHAVVREGYRRLIERHPPLHIVAEADSGEAAYRLYVEHTPDVVVMDITLPGASGIQTLQRIVQRDRDARVLIFTMHRDATFAEKALESGALGYVTKSSPPELLVHAICDVYARRQTISPDMLPDLAALRRSGSAAAKNPLHALSAREFEILRMLVAARSREDIAETLHISTKTVFNIHYQIKSKLGVSTDIELMHAARQLNLLD